MTSDIYWIAAPLAGRLAIMARPRAGDWLEDEIGSWQRAGVNTVVSLLEGEEVDELGLSQEAALCATRNIAFVSFPIPDRGLPASNTAALLLADRLAREIEAGQSVAVHCRAGIGRSAMMAALVLITTGIEGAAIFDLIGQARGVPVPDTTAQRDWVMALSPQQR
jgi:protein-tyrosine phosphatase